MAIGDRNNIEIIIKADTTDAETRIKALQNTIENLSAQKLDFGKIELGGLEGAFAEGFTEGLIEEVEKAGLSMEETAQVADVLSASLDGTSSTSSAAAGSVAQMGDAATTAESGFSRLGASIVVANQSFELIGRVTGTISELAQEAERLDNVSQGFNSLQESVGNIPTEKLEALREATQGAITDLDLMLVANKALIAGIDDGTGKFEELAGAAVRLGDALGNEAEDSVQALATALTAANERALRSTGIIVDSAAAFDTYAASLGTTADKLDDAQKRTAFMAAALESAREALSGLEPQTNTAAQAFDNLAKQAENNKNQFLQAISANDTLAEAVGRLSTDFSAAQGASAGFGNILGEIAGQAIKAAQGLGDILAPALDGLVNKFQQLTKFGADAANVFNRLRGADVSIDDSGTIKSVLDELNSVANEQVTAEIRVNAKLDLEEQKLFEPIDAAIENLVGGITEPLSGVGKTVNKEFDAIGNAYARLIDKFKTDDSLIKLEEPLQKLAQQLRNAEIEIKDVGPELVKIGKEAGLSADGVSKLGQAFEQLFKATPQEKAINNLISGITLRDELVDILPQVRELTTAFRLGQTDAAGLAAALEQVALASGLSADGVSRLGQVVSQELNKPTTLLENLGISLPPGVEGQLSASLAGVLQGAFESGDVRQAVQDGGQALGAAFGNFFGGPIGGVLGGQLGQFIGKELSEIGKSAKDNIEALGFALGGPAGLVGGKIIGSLVTGAKNAARSARDEFSAIFQKLIEDSGFTSSRLDLENLFELDPDAFNAITDTFGNTTTAVQEGLDSLQIPQELLSQFDALGVAFAETFQFGQEGIEGLVGQLGQILALNLQDAAGLNELQLLFERAEVSAEEFQQALEDAFFVGDISAQQFLESTSAVNNLFEDGIPGAVGATDLAFQNLADGGLESGQRALDALQDIAIEAGEAGITSFQQLQQVLIEQGRSAEEVSQLFSALQQQGITTLEQLASINLNQAATIVANLQQVGFAFKAAGVEIDATKAKLEAFRAEAEKEIVTKYTVQVSVEGDVDAAREFGGGDARKLQSPSSNKPRR